MSKTKGQFLEDYTQIIEKIVFDVDELEKLKIAVKNFTQGKTSAKELKQLLLQCRGRMVEDISDYILFIVKKIVSENTNPLLGSPSPSTSQIEAQLREEIAEKNELLEIVAQRINQLVLNLSCEPTLKGKKLLSEDEVKEEIEMCLDQIGAKEWIDICFYDDSKFFVKLYPKFEELYEERFYERDKTNNKTKDLKKIMANKMEELGFPEDIETIVIQYISIRNNFHHSMTDISPSNLKLAREVFTSVLVYLIVSNLNPTHLSSNQELFYSCLREFFSHQLTGNPAFRKEILERLKTVFNF